MTTDNALTVTRRQTTREEIDLAIDLLFTGGSMVCANLLAWAAIDVLKGIGKAQGVETFSDSVMSIVRKDKVRDWYNIVKEHYNFAKHSERDPDKIVELNPIAVKFAVYEALSNYQRIYAKSTIPMLMFQGYFLLTNLDLYESIDPNLVAKSQAFLGESPTLKSVNVKYQSYLSMKEEAHADLPPEVAWSLEI